MLCLCCIYDLWLGCLLKSIAEAFISSTHHYYCFISHTLCVIDFVFNRNGVVPDAHVTT